MKRGTQKVGRRLALALAMVVLPMLVVAPVMTGATLIHDHGEGLHTHRLTQREVATSSRPTHTPAHSHGAHHHHAQHPGHETAVELPSESPAPRQEDEDSGVFLLVPRLTVAHRASAEQVLTLPQPIHAPLASVLDGPVACVGPSSRGQRSWRAPPRRRVQELLLSNHALRI